MNKKLSRSMMHAMGTEASRERAAFLLETARQFLDRDLLTPDLFAAMSEKIQSDLSPSPQSDPGVPEIHTFESAEGLTKTVKELIRKSGLSLHELGRKTNIDPSQLSRFLRGQRDLSLGATERLCSFLQLRFAVAGDRDMGINRQ